jgi:curli biogenesis system outer membrane secretion channel CsgG
MLLTALVETGCFEVFERAALEEVKEEMRMHGKKPQDLREGADYVITGSITALEMSAAGKGGGGGGVVIPLPFIGGVGVKGGKSEAHIGLDLRAIRVKDAKIVVSKAVEGKSGRWNFGIGGFGWFGGGGAGGWFNSFKNTPLEEATRDVIAGAVTLLVESMAKKNITGTISPK